MDNSTKSISRSDLRRTSFLQVYQPLFDAKLNPLEKLILSEAISWHLDGKKMYTSQAQLAERMNVSRATIQRTMQHLQKNNYLVVTLQVKGLTKNSVIQLGHETIKLLIPKGDPVSITTSEPVKVEVASLEAETTPLVDYLPFGDVEMPTEAPKPTRAAKTRSMDPVQGAPLTNAKDPLPLDVVKRLNYYPKAERHELTENDVVLVFGCYGIDATQAKDWYHKAKYSLPNYNDKLQYAKDGAIALKKRLETPVPVAAVAPVVPMPDQKVMTEAEREQAYREQMRTENPMMYEMLYGMDESAK